jgi:hypothetical protein
MYSIELMDEAIALAERLGWRMRQEYLGEVGGGPCEIGGRKWIFLDIALSPPEQFEQLLDALRRDSALHTAKVPPALQPLLGVAPPVRRAA